MAAQTANDILLWLKEWFAKRHAPLPDGAEAESLNFFEAGLIDSLGVVGLIAEIESGFGVRFTQAHFQDARFSSLRGLSELIRELSASG